MSTANKAALNHGTMSDHHLDVVVVADTWMIKMLSNGLLDNSRTNQLADWSIRGHLLNKHGVSELTSPRVGCPRFGLSAS